MKIEGTDAFILKNQNIDKNVSFKERKDVSLSQISNIEEKMVSQITKTEKNELPISDKVVIEAIEKANKAITGANRSFEFSIHEKTKQIMIKVIDTETKEVVKEFPPEKILDMIAKMCEMAGILVDERR